MKPNPRPPFQQAASFYTVYDEETGEELLRGSKRECAEFMLSRMEENPENEYPFGLLKDGKEEASWDTTMLENWAKRPGNLPPLSDITDEEYRQLMEPDYTPEPQSRTRTTNSPVRVLSSQ